MNIETLRENKMGSKKSSINWWVCLIALWVLAVYVPILMTHWGRVRVNDYHLWVPISLVLTLGLGCWRWRLGDKVERDLPVLRLILILIACLGMLLLAYLFNSPFLAVAPFVLSLGVWMAYLGGKRNLTGWFGVWGLCLLLCRLPGQLERRILSDTLALSGKLASSGIDALGLLNSLRAQDITVSSQTYGLEVICSGYYSVYLVIALAAYLCYFKGRPIVHSAMLILSSLLVAIVVNALRIVTVVMAQEWWQVDAIHGIWAMVLLALSVLCSLLTLLSVDSLLELLLAPSSRPDRPRGRMLTRWWNTLVEMGGGQLATQLSRGAKPSRLLVRAGAGLLVLVLCLMTGLVITVKKAESETATTDSMNVEKDLVVIDPNLVKFTRPGWKMLKLEREKRDFKSIWGAYSFIWRLQYHDTMVIMAMDYPFDQWHDVKVCYGALGWVIQKENVTKLDGSQWEISETDMVLPTGDHGFILCSLVDQEGGALKPKPAETGWRLLKYKLGPRQWVEPFKQNKSKDANTLYQSQSMVTSTFPLDEPTKQEIREAYGEFREQTRLMLIESNRE